MGGHGLLAHSRGANRLPALHRKARMDNKTREALRRFLDAYPFDEAAEASAWWNLRHGLPYGA
jgi:hypothetical protein